MALARPFVEPEQTENRHRGRRETGHARQERSDHSQPKQPRAFHGRDLPCPLSQSLPRDSLAQQEQGQGADVFPAPLALPREACDGVLLADYAGRPRASAPRSAGGELDRRSPSTPLLDTRAAGPCR